MKRRDFLQKTSVTAAVGVFAPTIVPASVFGKSAPSNQINVGMVGTGRQAVQANLKNGFLNLENCRVIAVNDVDSWRMNLGAKTVNDAYSKEGKKYVGVQK